MRPQLEAVAATQGGIFLRRQALASGVTAKEFDLLTRGAQSPWVRIRYGVYIRRDQWSSLDETRQWLLRDRSALLVCDRGTILSHSSAARLSGLPLYGVDDNLTHVTRLRTHARRVNRVEAEIKHHCARIAASDVIVIDGLQLTGPERTVMDLTTEFGYETGLVAADAALHAGASRAELHRIAELTPNNAGTPRRRAVAADADPKAESPLETLARVLLRKIGIDDVQTQFEISVDGKAIRTDLYSSALHHVFECDGKVKYREGQMTNGRKLTPWEVVWREKSREDDIRRLGFGVSRVTWPDAVTTDIERVGQRIRREVTSQNAAGRLLRSPG